MTSPTDESDRNVRRFVYDVTLRRGYPPTVAETATGLSAAQGDVRASFQRLAAGRVLVLQPGSGEILMANPFSAVPTPFLVELDDYSCYGNCIYDALGIPAMLHKDARIKTSCGDCGLAMEVRIVKGSLRAVEGIIHFAIPALHWWDDIVFN